MKKAIKVLFVGLIIGSMAVFYSCSDDDENPDSDLDPNVFCDENLCSTDSDLKDECIDAFNTCLATEPDANDDECAITALAICRP
jgi:hypothetical protein